MRSIYKAHQCFPRFFLFYYTSRKFWLGLQACLCKGTPILSGERHNNGTLVPTARTAEPKNIQSAAVACPLTFHSVSSVCSLIFSGSLSRIPGFLHTFHHIFWCSCEVNQTDRVHLFHSDSCGAVGISPLVALEQKEEKCPQLPRTELAS